MTKQILIGATAAVVGYVAIEAVKKARATMARNKAASAYDSALAQAQSDFDAGLPVGFW